MSRLSTSPSHASRPCGYAPQGNRVPILSLLKNKHFMTGDQMCTFGGEKGTTYNK